MEKKIAWFDARMKRDRMKYDLTVNGKPFRIEVPFSGRIVVDGKPLDAGLVSGPATPDLLTMGRKVHEVYLRKSAEHHYEVWINCFVIDVELADERDRLVATYRQQHPMEKSILTVRAPMPGIVTAIHATLGESIQSGGGLLVLEAMKMENEICSPHAGKVKAIMVKEKTAVEKDQPLLSIEPE